MARQEQSVGETFGWSQTDPKKDATVIFRVNGKTGEREVVARNHKNGAVEYLRRIKALYDAPKPNDFIFVHPNGKPIKSLKMSFSSLMEFVGVEFDGVGRKHTIYSLRHTCASMKLTEGVSMYALARYMGTSVAMIERFYGTRPSSRTNQDER